MLSLPAEAVAEPKTRVEPAAEVVDCSVFAPPQAPAGSSLMVQVFAHLPEQAGDVDRMAKEFDGGAGRRATGGLDELIRRGTKLAFRLSMPGLQVDPPAQRRTWRGRPEAVQFGVNVPQDFEPGNVNATLLVSGDGVPIGHIKFVLEVVAAGQRAASAPVEAQAQPRGKWVRYKEAFISYASQDRREVLKRVQMLARVNIKYFQDVLKLDPGQRWEREIYRHIDSCDVFFLFWSSSAKASEWVLKEALYALDQQKKRGDEVPEIVPIIIEGPPPILPPPELSFLHFDDRFIYFINARGRILYTLRGKLKGLLRSVGWGQAAG